MPRSRRSNYTPEEIKKRQDKLFGFDKKRPKAQYEKNRAKNTGRDKKDDKKVTTTKKLTGAERAKALAKKNIKKYGGTAKAAAANKAAMRLKIKKAYLAKKKKKK